MAWTQKDIAAIEKALASGVTRVAYADRSVDYQSRDELKQTLAEIRAEVNRTAHGGIVYQTVGFSKGLR